MQQNHRTGFTLFELSIVLVIIGLLVGSIVLGQDLIEEGALRATAAQIEKYRTAVNTFRIKYNGIPGDLKSDLAAQAGFISRSGQYGHGDGDGILNSDLSGPSASGEEVLFWNDLSTANLIEGRFLGDDSGPMQMSSAQPNSAGFAIIADAMAMGSGAMGFAKEWYQPAAKIQKGNFIIAYSDSSINYFEITGLTSTTVDGIYNLYNALTPLEAFNIDNKLDDGNPLTGRVMAMEGAAADTLAVPGAATCVAINSTQYNDSIASPLCHLRLRMQ